MKYKITSILLLIMLIAACQPTVIRLGGRIDRRPTVERQNFFLAGLVGERTLEMKDYCSGGNVAKIKEEFTFGDKVWQILTLNIYSPRTVSIYCRLKK